MYVASSTLARSAGSFVSNSASDDDADLEVDGRGSGTTLRWCRNIQKTSFVTFETSRHQSLNGRDTRISSTKFTGRASSGLAGSPRYVRILRARCSKACGDEVAAAAKKLTAACQYI